jgi:Subtilase family
MPRFKLVDMSPRLLPVDLRCQILPGRFEHALCQLIAFVAPSSGGAAGIFTTDVSYHNRGFNIGQESTGGADGLHTNSFGGTSSATPLAAGVAALLLSLKAGAYWERSSRSVGANRRQNRLRLRRQRPQQRIRARRINAGKAIQALLS